MADELSAFDFDCLAPEAEWLVDIADFIALAGKFNGEGIKCGNEIAVNTVGRL